MPGRAPYTVGLALLVLTLACRKPPDPDGVLGQANLLRLGASRADELRCDRGTGDCADWYTVQIDERGELAALVEGRATGKGTETLTVELRDEQGDILDSKGGEARGETRVSQAVEPGAFFVAVTCAKGETALPYRVRVSFEPEPPPAPAPVPEAPPPPPEPRFEIRSGAVLEVEGREAGGAVLIEVGAAQGIAPGQLGRLVDEGREIGRIVVEEVFPDGSRARIEGVLAAPVTARTLAEVEVPVEPPPAP